MSVSGCPLQVISGRSEGNTTNGSNWESKIRSADEDRERGVADLESRSPGRMGVAPVI